MYCIYMFHADLQQRLQDIWTKHYKTQMSHEKNPRTFHYTDCFIGIGILIMVCYNPHLTV